ncbi:MAG: hypothetical protein GTO40_19580, partial [Deltaproteobacteria bacterium]|nr:hypothetical protein [Deltaproteobacteria bacterium]
MDRNELKQISQKLHRQRKVFWKEFKEAETGLRVIAEERESEFEEAAKEE